MTVGGVNRIFCHSDILLNLKKENPSVPLAQWPQSERSLKIQKKASGEAFLFAQNPAFRVVYDFQTLLFKVFFRAYYFQVSVGVNLN